PPLPLLPPLEGEPPAPLPPVPDDVPPDEAPPDDAPPDGAPPAAVIPAAPNVPPVGAPPAALGEPPCAWPPVATGPCPPDAGAPPGAPLLFDSLLEQATLRHASAATRTGGVTFNFMMSPTDSGQLERRQARPRAL